MMGLGLGFGLFHFVWMFMFWVAVIALAIWLVSLLFPAAKGQNENNNATLSALEILKTRYAQGELTVEQYQEMLQTIRQYS